MSVDVKTAALPASLQKLIVDHPEDQYLKDLAAHFEVFNEIHQACGKTWRYGCGSYMIDGRSYQYDASTYPKQTLLYQMAKKATRVLEIGTYQGHSAFIMLLGNPKMQLTLVDNDPSFSPHAVKVLEKHFNTKIDFRLCDSLKVFGALKEEGKRYDMFHFDGWHTVDYVEPEFRNGMELAEKDVTVVFDDYDQFPQFVDSLGRSSKASDYILPDPHTCTYRNAVFRYHK